MKTTSFGKVLGYIALVLVIFAAGGVAGWVLSGTPNKSIVPVSTPAPVPTPAPTPSEPVVAPATSAVKVSAVDWTPQKTLTDLKLFPKDSLYTSGHTEYCNIGTVKKAPYAGGMLIRAYGQADMGGTPTYNFIKTTDSRYVLLTRYSNQSFYNDGKPLTSKAYQEDATFTIPELDYPETLFGPAGETQKLVRQDNPWGTDESAKLKKLFTDPVWGDVYVDEDQPDTFVQNGYYLHAPDGTLRTYALELPLMGKENIPAITWNDGTQNATEYSATSRTGCGSSDYAAVVRDSSVLNNLVPAGKLSNGDTAYELKDANSPLLKVIYDVYGGQYSSSGTYNKISFEKFIALRPVFFWKDSFGRFIRFQNAQFVPQAECGKPVIYLYPEKTTNVSVKLTPKGGFTYTEPAYKDGWNVVANPDGQLVENASGKTYPYLFWEGRVGIYEQPKKGFSVRREDVSSFLDTSLASLGLQGKEISDFKEFWLPRMQSAPYYFVTFMGTKTMDSIAPLEITPKPDTVIRILMDFSPLKAPIKVEPVTLKKIPRNGFTVIEWGGVIQK